MPYYSNLVSNVTYYSTHSNRKNWWIHPFFQMPFLQTLKKNKLWPEFGHVSPNLIYAIMTGTLPTYFILLLRESIRSAEKLKLFYNIVKNRNYILLVNEKSCFSFRINMYIFRMEFLSFIWNTKPFILQLINVSTSKKKMTHFNVHFFFG